MAASDGASTITSVETQAREEKEETVEVVVEKTLGSTEAQMVMGDKGNEGSTCATAQPCSSSSPVNDEKDHTKTLDFAAELMEKGSDAMKAGDYSEAADCFSRAVEIRVAHYGEMASECSTAYYKYGCALLYKAQEEADPLGSVPKKENDAASKGECSTTAVVVDVQQEVDAVPNKEDNNDANGKDKIEEADDEEEESDAEDLAENDEEESDLDLAWKMLDLARAIVEKNPDDTMEKVDILSALGEVALEREDIETSLNDYTTALSILERLVEKDSRRIAELNFRICLVLEVGSRANEAIPFCEKALSICKARIQRLTDEVKEAAPQSSETAVSAVDKVNETVDASHSDPDKAAEITDITGLFSDLEKKLEDLQQLVVQPTSLLSEVLSMISAKANNSGGKNLDLSASFSSRVGTIDSGGDFDSPTVSTAHTNGNAVTHLGVVGRGVKRVLTNSNTDEPSSVKKPAKEEKGKGNAA